jgi:hypothetical protein
LLVIKLFDFSFLPSERGIGGMKPSGGDNPSSSSLNEPLLQATKEEKHGGEHGDHREHFIASHGLTTAGECCTEAVAHIDLEIDLTLDLTPPSVQRPMNFSKRMAATRFPRSGFLNGWSISQW